MNTKTAVLSQPLSLLFFKQQSSYHSGGVLSSRSCFTYRLLQDCIELVKSQYMQLKHCT